MAGFFGTEHQQALQRRTHDELGARCVYELVAPSNLASRRMVEGCGLSLAPDLRCGVAVPADAARFTR
jgi:RimJ/RimL family protein N-acetyltransferase